MNNLQIFEGFINTLPLYDFSDLGFCFDGARYVYYFNDGENDDEHEVYYAGFGLWLYQFIGDQVPCGFIHTDRTKLIQFLTVHPPKQISAKFKHYTDSIKTAEALNRLYKTFIQNYEG